MTQIVDVKSALIAFLKADADVTTQVGTRVFGLELPRSETDNMPRKAVVLVASGGAVPGYAAATLPVEAQRVDTYCYGATPFEAEEVRRAVYGALKAMSRTKQGSVLLHWAEPSGGPMSGRDPDLDWPVVWNSWQILADERTAS